MVKHTFIIVTEDREAAAEFAAVADKHEGAIDIDYTTETHIRKTRSKSND